MKTSLVLINAALKKKKTSVMFQLLYKTQKIKKFYKVLVSFSKHIVQCNYSHGQVVLFKSICSIKGLQIFLYVQLVLQPKILVWI